MADVSFPRKSYFCCKSTGPEHATGCTLGGLGGLWYRGYRVRRGPIGEYFIYDNREVCVQVARNPEQVSDWIDHDIGAPISAS